MLFQSRSRRRPFSTRINDHNAEKPQTSVFEGKRTYEDLCTATSFGRSLDMVLLMSTEAVSPYGEAVTIAVEILISVTAWQAHVDLTCGRSIGAVR